MSQRTITVQRNDIAALALTATAATIRKATARGINYAVKRARTRMKKAITDEYKLPSSTVVTTNNGGTLTITPAKSTKLCASVNANVAAESLGHFRPVQYKDVYGGNKRGGAGGGFIKYQQRGAGYTGTRNLTRNTKKSGIYVEVVRGRRRCIPGAFLLFKGSSVIVMARGDYQGTGQTRDFKFEKPRLPINKLNTKSIYWGVLHRQSVGMWEPDTYKQMLDETERQLKLLFVP